MLHIEAKTERMTSVHRAFLAAVLVLTVIPGWKLLATLPTPEMVIDQVTPEEAVPGTVVTLTGHALDRAHVQDLYLLNEGNAALPMEILTATGNTLRFRIPEKTPAGLMEIAIKAPNRGGLVDQMMFLRVL